MDHNAIIARVSDAKIGRDLPDLIRDLEGTDPRVLFDALFPIAIRRQGAENGPVAFSAYALHALNPPCPITADKAVAMITEQDWDISIEEVPWYLTNQFGADELLRCIDDAFKKQADEQVRVKLGTMRYWVRLNPKSPRRTSG